MSKLFLILLLALPAYGQMPDHGSLADIQGKTKFFVNNDEPARSSIIKAFDKSDLKNVDKADDAEFFMSYKMISRDPINEGLGMYNEHGLLEVFILRDKKKIIVWSVDGYGGGGFKQNTPLSLAKKFVKALNDKK